ncbi:MAG: LysR family transcriptional regulator [Neisseriales bacterium]|nr:MAG: LysR family transcriptional regulator [Neisseriales bacterium]
MYDDILFFLKVAEHTKFSTAAEKLGLSQSTISRKITALEEALRLRLIKKDSRNLELTEEGQNLSLIFKNVETEIKEMVSQSLIKNKKYNNIINIVLPVGMVGFKFSRTLATLGNKLAGMDLNLTYYAGNVDIERYNYDMAIVSLGNKKEYQSAVLVYSSKVILVCSKRYIEANGLCTSIDDFANHMVVGNVRILEDDLIPLLYKENENTTVKLPVDYKLYLNSFIEAKNLVLSDIAISGLMENDIKDELASGELVRLLPDYHKGYMNYYLISRLDMEDIRYKSVLELIKHTFEN